MKKLFIFIITIVALQSSCKKEIIETRLDSNYNASSINSYVNLPVPDVEYINYISNTIENQDQKKYNTSIYYLAKAMTEICKHPNLLAILHNKFESSNLINFDELMIIEEFRLVIERELALDNQKYNDIVTDMKIGNIKYYPTIEFTNFDSKFLSIADLPIIAAGVPYEYYTAIDTLGTYVMAWKSDNDKYVEVLINENKKDSIASPVFIVNSSTDYVAKVEIGNSMKIKEQKVEQSPIIQAQWNTQFSGFKIEHRYESDRYSNYRYTGAIQTTNGLHNQDIEGGLICNVHKNDIGKSIVPRWGSLRLNNSFNSQTEIYTESYYITYEYDWYSTFKFVTVGNTQVGSIIFKCRMNGADEYYQIARTIRNTHVSHFGKGFINIYNPCCLI